MEGHLVVELALTVCMTLVGIMVTVRYMWSEREQATEPQRVQLFDAIARLQSQTDSCGNTSKGSFRDVGIIAIVGGWVILAFMCWEGRSVHARSDGRPRNELIPMGAGSARPP